MCEMAYFKSISSVLGVKYILILRIQSLINLWIFVVIYILCIFIFQN